jgi:hypothetical protein
MKNCVAGGDPSELMSVMPPEYVSAEPMSAVSGTDGSTSV